MLLLLLLLLFLVLIYSNSEWQEHSISCLLLYIKTDWFLSCLRYVQCRFLNDRLPQGLSSSIFFPLLFLLLFVQYRGFKWSPTNNKPDHNSYHTPSLYSIPDTAVSSFSFLFSIKTHFAEKITSIYTSLTPYPITLVL